MIKQIIFVTGNSGKLLHAQVALEEFGIKVISKTLDIIEPREEEPEIVSKEKVLQAFKILKKPLMVEDSGIFISGLNGFPKTFVHFAEDTLGVENIIKMMSGVKDRKVEFRQSLAYIEPGMSEPIVFSYVDKGFTLADHVWDVTSSGWGEFDRIIIPPGEKKALCTFSKEWRAKRDAESNKGNIHYHQLAQWFKNRK